MCAVKYQVQPDVPYGDQPVPYVPVRITRCALVAHRYLYVPLSAIKTIIFLSVSLWNALADPVFNGVELAGFNSN